MMTMSENDRRRRRVLSNLIMNTSTMLAIIALATTFMYLYTRYSMTITKSMVPRDRPRRNISDGRYLGVAKSPTIVVNTYVADDATDVERKKNVINFTTPDSISSEEGRTSYDQSVADKKTPRMIGRSLNTISIRDEPETTTSTIPLSGLQNELVNIDSRPVYQADGIDKVDDNDDQGKNDEPYDVIDDVKIYQINKRTKSQRGINQNDYSNTMNRKLKTRNYGSTNYKNPYGSTNIMGDYNYKKSENPSYGTGWVTLGTPESLWPGTEGEIWETPPREPQNRYTINNGYDYTAPPNGLITYDHYPVYNHQHVANGWKQIGTLVLLKLGFLKILFFLIYKIVIFTRLVSFKFQLIQKLTDSFISLPASVLGSFTTIMNILMSVLMLLSSTMTPVDQLPVFPGSNPSRFGGVIPNLWSRIVKRIASSSSLSRPAQTGISSRTIINSMLQNVSMENRAPGMKVERSLNPHDLNLVNKRSYESSRFFEPAVDIIKNVLDSERCVERIFCQIAAVEKSGTTPMWFHWILNGISNIISIDKLESYLETYKAVNNEVYTKLPTPDNWISWCQERYNCNNTFVTKVTDTKQ